MLKGACVQHRPSRYCCNPVVSVCACMFVCVYKGLSGNESAAFDSSKQLVLFIANSTRLVDMAECD